MDSHRLFICSRHSFWYYREWSRHPGQKNSLLFYIASTKFSIMLSLKGGITAAEMNRSRMEQLVKGALTQDMFALRVRMSHSMEHPPSFSQLMHDVREEENWMSAREGMKTAASTATVTVPQSSVTSELNSLRDEVKELSSHVAKLFKSTPSNPYIST